MIIFPFQHWKKTGTFFLLAPVILLCAFRGFESNYLRMRTAGDKAFAKKDYASAASFYRQCRQSAIQSNNADSLRDSYEHLIDALILGKLPQEAEKELAKYELHFPGVNPLSLAMWRADILILKKEPEQAEKIMDRILPGLTVEDPRRIRAIHSLARACEAAGKYRKAAETYRLLQNTAPPELKRLAHERAVLCFLHSSNPELAWNELLSIPLSENKAERFNLKLLTFYLTIRTSGFQYTAPAWKEIQTRLQKTPDDLSFAILSGIADTAAKSGHYSIALEAYHAACAVSPDKHSTYETVRRMTEILDLSDNKKEAAEMALKMLDVFRGNYADAATKIQVAELLASAGKYKEAVLLYTALADDPGQSRKTVEEAAVCASKILLKAGDPVSAEKNIIKYFPGKNNSGRCAFLLADLKLTGKKYTEAASAFRKTASDFPELRDKALYQAGIAFSEAKDLSAALDTIAELQKLKPEPQLMADSEFLRANILLAANDLEGAAAAFSAYAGMKKIKTELAARALFESGRIWFRLNDSKKSEAAFSELRKKYPDSPQAPAALYWQIYACRINGNFLRAERMTWQLADRYPQSRQAVAAMFNLASYYAASGSSRRAEDLLNNILDRLSDTPALKAQVLLRKAKLAFQDKESGRAAEFLKKLEQDYPNTPEAAEGLYLQADQLRLENKYAEAIKLYRKILKPESDPAVAAAAAGSLADCLFTMAVNLEGTAGFKKAAEAYQAVLEYTDLPEHIRVMTLYKLGRARELTGADDPALQSYKQALCYLHPDSGSTLQFWALKTAERIISIAEKRPVRSHIAAAEEAIHTLAENEIFDHEQAAQRIQKIQQLKRRF